MLGVRCRSKATVVAMGEKGVAASCAAITFRPRKIYPHGFRSQDHLFAFPDWPQTVLAAAIGRRRRHHKRQGDVGHIWLLVGRVHAVEQLCTHPGLPGACMEA